MKTTTHVHLPALLCVLATATGAGCKKAPETTQIPAPSTPAAAPAWPATRKTDRGSFTVTIQPDGGSIARDRHFSLQVLVQPGAGAATPVSVLVDADMPSHGHGMNTKPEIIHEGGPRYRANGMLFHMAGEWSISVDVSAGTNRARALFPVSVE